MVIVNEKIYLRAWTEDDASACYCYSKDPAVGPIARWPVHQCIDESRKIIRNVFMKPEVYAIILKETDLPIGCIGLKRGSDTDLTDYMDECEFGYWLGKLCMI